MSEEEFKMLKKRLSKKSATVEKVAQTTTRSETTLRRIATAHTWADYQKIAHRDGARGLPSDGQISIVQPKGKKTADTPKKPESEESKKDAEPIELTTLLVSLVSSIKDLTGSIWAMYHKIESQDKAKKA
jgi:hypothetical protein